MARKNVYIMKQKQHCHSINFKIGFTSHAWSLSNKSLKTILKTKPINMFLK